MTSDAFSTMRMSSLAVASAFSEGNTGAYRLTITRP